MEEPNTTEDQTLTVPAGACVIGAEFDTEGPYIEYFMADDFNSDRIRVAVPNALAYYLRTHWCGSQHMHDLIWNSAIAHTRSEITDTGRKLFAAIGITPEETT